MLNSVFAGVWPASDTWEAIGDVTIQKTYNDTGADDGVGDGGLFVDGQSAVVGQGCQYTFYGSGTEGQTMSIVASLSNVNASYVQLKMELYDADDASVIATTANEFIGSGESRDFSLSVDLPASSEGHRIQLRFIRTDDGNAVRNFLIDYVVSDGWYFPGSTNFRRKPDITLEALDSELQDDINAVKLRLKSDQLGTSEPTLAQIQSAEASFDALGISQGSHGVAGPVLGYQDVSFLRTFAQYLTVYPDDLNIKNKASLTVELVGRNLLDGHIGVDGAMYSFRHFSRSAVYLDQHLSVDAKGMLGYLFDAHFVNLARFWEPDDQTLADGGWLNTDVIYNGADTLLYYGLCHSDTDEESQRWAKGVNRYLERFYSYGPGTTDGIKPDGSGFHHWNDYVDYMYAMRTGVKVVYALRDTSVQISQPAYGRLRDNLTALLLKGRDNCLLLAMSGRSPFPRNMPVGQIELRLAAIAGGGIMNLATPDPVLSQIHNTLFGEHVDLGVSGEWNLGGFYSMNYSTAGIAWGNGWLAGAKGFDQGLWGSEIYPTANRYGRYLAYGSLEILYPGGALEGNGASDSGFNWNYISGATTIVLPWSELQAEKDRIDEVQQENFVGSLSLGAKDSPILTDYSGHYGFFAMDFKESDSHYGGGLVNHNTSFEFKKSCFFFGEYVLALGSGISNDDGISPTATTLYQRAADHASATISAEVIVDGNATSSYGSQALTTGQNHWLIDNFSTGFYLPSSNDGVLQSRAVQSSPLHGLVDPSDTGAYASGDFTMAYIDHGTAPSSASYEYAVVPNTTSNDMNLFAQKMQSASPLYQVHQQDGNAHVVEEMEKEIWAYAIFSSSGTFPVNGPVDSVSIPCLVMTKNHQFGAMTMAITDPDMRLSGRSYLAVPSSLVSCTINGTWTLSGGNSQVQSLSHSAGKTTIEVLIEQASSVNVELIQDEDGDGYSSALELAMGSDPAQSESIPDFEIIIDLSTIPSGQDYLQFEAVSGLFFDLEKSTDLESWEWDSAVEATQGLNQIPVAIDLDELDACFFRLKLRTSVFP